MPTGWVSKWQITQCFRPFRRGPWVVIRRSRCLSKFDSNWLRSLELFIRWRRKKTWKPVADHDLREKKALHQSDLDWWTPRLDLGTQIILQFEMKKTCLYTFQLMEQQLCSIQNITENARLLFVLKTTHIYSNENVDSNFIVPNWLFSPICSPRCL